MLLTYIPIEHVFEKFLFTLKEYNTYCFSPTFLLSAFETLLTKVSLLEIPYIQQRCPIDYNPHHWLIHDILKTQQFQYKFLSTFSLSQNTAPHYQIYSLFFHKKFSAIVIKS